MEDPVKPNSNPYYNNNVQTFMDGKDIRQKFIVKVYSILTVQVLVSIAIIAAILNMLVN